MLYLDIDAINAKFFAVPLTYKDSKNVTQTLAPNQLLVENGPTENVDETKPWVRWTINPGESKRTAVSPALFTSLGTATLQVFAPKGTGVGVAIDIKSAFENAFRDWRSPDKCLRIYKMSSTKGTDKDFLQINVTVYYESKRLA